MATIGQRMLSLVLAGTAPRELWHVRGELAGITIDVCTLQATREAADRWVREHQPELIASTGIQAGMASFGQALALYRDLCSPAPEEQLRLDRVNGALAAERLADIDGATLARVAHELGGQDGSDAQSREMLAAAATVLHFAARNGLCRFVGVKRFAGTAEERPPGGRWGEFR